MLSAQGQHAASGNILARMMMTSSKLQATETYVTRAEILQQFALRHLASIDMCHDTDVSVCVQRYLSGNCSQLVLVRTHNSIKLVLCKLKVRSLEAACTVNA